VGKVFPAFFAANGAPNCRVGGLPVAGVQGALDQRATVALNQPAGALPPNMFVELFQRHERGGVALRRGTRKLFGLAVYLVGSDSFNGQT